MNNTIEYDIRDGVINPEYIGIITEPRDESYRFEDFRITPKMIQEIDAHIRNNSPLEYTVFDCHDEAELSSVWYSKLEFGYLDTVYLFWGIWCDKDTDVTFSIESVAMQRLWINGKLQTLCFTKTKTRRQLFTFRLCKGIDSVCLQQHGTIHVSITGINGSFDSLMANLEYMKNRTFSVNVKTPLMKKTWIFSLSESIVMQTGLRTAFFSHSSKNQR